MKLSILQHITTPSLETITTMDNHCPSTIYKIPGCCFVIFQGGAAVCCDLKWVADDDTRCDVGTTADCSFRSLGTENYHK
jgi:hypothetical protein